MVKTESLKQATAVDIEGDAEASGQDTMEARKAKGPVTQLALANSLE